MANAIVTTRPKPNYVVFPELAIPRRWIRTLSHHFLKERISLIAGVEYGRLSGSQTEVVNDVRLYLTDNRLGHPSWVALRQRKGLPAHHERDELRLRGLRLAPPDEEASRKWIYRHFGFHFGILICSELTDIEHRRRMRGDVDNLFVLCWNQDLESFSSLLESSALDVHSFMTLVNNRKYGDSRVRAPYAEHWKRDLVRVKGGLHDYFVVTELDYGELRDFQSYTEPPPGPFKPFPEGFTIHPRRRQVPGG